MRCIPLEHSKLKRLFNMISVWLLFQALWQWVGEDRLRYYSFAVLQCAVTVPVCLHMKLGGDTQWTHEPYCANAS